MFWGKYYDSNKELCVETEFCETIDLIANGTNIGFDSRAPTEHELQLLPHVHLKSKFQLNSETVHLGKVRSDALEINYIAFQFKNLRETERGDY